MGKYIEESYLVNALAVFNDRKNGNPHFLNGIETAREVISEAPAADVAPVVHARWVECDYVEPCVHGFGTIRHKNKGLKCTNCVHVFKTELLWKDDYCPSCGAKMDLEG